MPKNMKSKVPVKSADVEGVSSTAILGTYEGECADSNITNLNGLDITREVWENVFNSDEYKNAIEKGWYIGFLGHPEGESADFQDYRRACIVMTEGHINDNGKVYGKFNLIDTPVGRIVKSFQDAGVIFGISVRGAGDIIQHSVDPETFIFRGFDLVTFPAFPESIPKFVAASTDADKRKKYQAICASVKANMQGLDTIESITAIQSCFAPQSDMYQELETRKAEILNDDSKIIQSDPLPEPGSVELVGEVCETNDPRIDSLTKLYLETKEQLDALKLAYQDQCAMYDTLVKDGSRRLNSIERICTSQIRSLDKKIEEDQISYRRSLEKINASTARRKQKLIEANTSLSSANRKISNLKSELKSVRASVSDLTEENESLKSALRTEINSSFEVKSENLEYNTKIKANEAIIDKKDAIIASLKSKLDETVNKNSQAKKDASNLDEQVESLQSKLSASEAIIKEYQDAYSTLYAHAIGVRLPPIRVTASTDVNSLQKIIRSSTSIAVKPSVLEPTQILDESDINIDNYDEDELVTL